MIDRTSMPEPEGRHNEEAIKAFFNEWSVYDLMVKNDYMAHAGIHQALRRDLAARRQPISVIDLGCGDASRIAGTLKGLPVRQYVGVDLSAVALDVAGRNIGTIAANALFFEMDLVSFLDSAECETADVIVAGFAAHHLDLADKQRFLQLCSARLESDGALYYYDVFRRPGETREQYLLAYLTNLDDTWRELSPEARERTKDHVLRCDRPETYSTIAALAAEAGFSTADEPLFQDGIGFHRLYRFTL
jgi:SAM-dependent methyltransferase